MSLIHAPNPEPEPQVYGRDTAIRNLGPTVPDPPPPAAGPLPPGHLPCPTCGMPAPILRPGYRGTIVSCERCGGAGLVHDVPDAARVVPVAQAGGAPERPTGRPVPPLQAGEVRLGDALDQYIKCEARNGCGCGGVARVSGSRAKGAMCNDHLMIECNWFPRMRPAWTPVVLVERPATEPCAEPPYLRNLPQNLPTSQ
jgi:hypothetical protein